MTHAPASLSRPVAHVPGYIRLPGPIIRGLLRAGVPIGPNRLVTVRGRVSGEPRTQALAVIEIDGRRYVVGTFGDVNWCRNLRANPGVEMRLGGRRETLRAVELGTDQAARFFRDVLVPGIPRMPLLTRIASRALISGYASDIVTDPEAAATRRPVFELVRAS